MIFFLDTETTGLPNGYAPIEEQPYLVQVAGILCDDSGKAIAQVNRLIRPDGWTIPYEATAIHGFTTEYCMRNGVPLQVAIGEVQKLWSQAIRIVAYNVAFDNLMMQFSAQRIGCSVPQRELYCAMRESAKLISDSGRWMKLHIAYRCFFGHEPESSHEAMADVEACKRIYYALQERLAPVTRLIGSVKGITKSKLQRVLAGAKEVEEHQELVNSLIKMHCNPLRPIDWRNIAELRNPSPPAYSSTEEMAAVERRQSFRSNLFQRLFDLDSNRIAALDEEVEAAKERDRIRHKEILSAFEATAERVKERRDMAKKIIAGNMDAYCQVMDGCDIGASPLLARHIVHSFIDSKTVEIFAYLNGEDVIPTQTKSLLASGRVSVKKAKKKESTLLYQDYLCSAALRVALDFMAILPVDRVLIHGFAPGTDSATGLDCERCLLSCLLEREKLKTVILDQIDPSDCVSSFTNVMKIAKGILQEVNPLQLPIQKSGRTRA
jgi:hypothetical protein